MWTNRSGKPSEPKVTTTEASWFPDLYQGRNNRISTGWNTHKSEDTCGLRSNQANFEYQVYNKKIFLHQYPKFEIKARKIKVADGRVIIINECVNIVISFASHIFEMVVYLLHMDDNFDFVIGQKVMYQLERGPNFGGYE